MGKKLITEDTFLDTISLLAEDMEAEVETPPQWKADVVKMSDNRYSILFSGGEENCAHAKHLIRIKGNIFVFCKATHYPICVYCSTKIVNTEEAAEMLNVLVELSPLLDGITGNQYRKVGSIYYKSLSKVLLSVKTVNIIES